MNTIAHAYSVALFLLVLVCTLIGFPMSVFSQSEVRADDAVSTESLPASTSGSEEVVIVDNYPRENLPGKEVYSDFVVGPGKFALEIAPGESKTVEMVVSNRMGEKKRFSFETEDMTGSSDPSQAVVLLGDAQGPYTLKDYIKIPYTQFDLEHGQRARIPVTVSLPPDAEPGGRYGSLVVSIVSNPVSINETSGAKPGSAIISRIGTLFFVTTPGAIEQDGELTSFETVGAKKFFSTGPIPFGIVMENKGSVHLTPYGEVRLYNMSGNEVGFIELDPWFAMPKSLRLREVSWDRDFLLGRYTAVAKINRGYDNIVDEKSFTFWVVPYDLLIGVFVGLFTFFLILYFILTRFEFKRKER
jgi:hypothetical protein